LADRAALRRVVCGLVQNAIKYTPDGGRIVIDAAAEAGEARISVSDTGRGIRGEDTPHIFEKFYRVRFSRVSKSDPAAEQSRDDDDTPGVGLGLYLARAIVEDIGGRISVESKVGEGSTFTVTLPSWDNKTQNTEPKCLSGC
jgi:signal transduction histidine kinase